ncbi:MAG: ATP-dependent DNA helicase RecG [Bacilli bacterium]|nr:ATP-dependent DNA helicase RecG [Bacilli bacterium]
MDLTSINGIGDKTIKILNNMNIFSVEDLINYYPYKYNFYKPENINNYINETITINGIVESIPKAIYIKKNFNYLSFRVVTSNKIINVTIFNRNFLKNNLTIGKEICLIGKYNKEKNTFTANNILLTPLLESIIEPIYHIKNNLKNKQLNNLICNTLNNIEQENTLPEYIIERYNFINEHNALKEIHNPKNINNLKQAKIYLKYKELFEFMFKINYLKIKRNINLNNIKKEFDKEKIKELINSLPFDLTQDQNKAIEDILNDFNSNKRMNRLVIGDVGSGKTIVAFIAIYANILSKYQSAFLAPTEILANQHFINIQKTIPNINVELLTSTTSKTKRKEILTKLKNNELDCIIGTHSLINEEVQFNNLGLVITDEQHRFGVNQRKNLQNKGDAVDVLYMSATPIPRTYALTIYGDMDISEIKTKPSGRKEVITKLYKESDIKECLNIMLDEIKKGHQIYVVSPLVEEQDEEGTLYDVEKLYDKLNIAFNNKIDIGILHGKLKTKEKETIMDNFKQGKIKILVSTTVIEVGVDVKNATCMVIFNAERFGLSTLHQLRGRVGRNDLTSYCLLVSNYDKERLNVLCSSTDGFYISEKDFELRGSGNLFGTEQSGEMSFKLANIKEDIKILNQTNIDSKEFIEKNINNFSEYPYYQRIIDSISFID